MNSRTTWLKILAIGDFNKNGLLEIVFRAGGCFLDRCGSLFVAEWDGTKFAGLIKDTDGTNAINYAEMGYPKDSYVKDLDKDGISEVVWVGGIPEEDGDYGGMPFRVETHIYKWDGANYVPQLVEYGKPIYRFQAVLDGDRYALNGQYEKAINSYREAIKNESLGWWTEARRNDFISKLGYAPCGDNITCPVPEIDPNEKPILQAYAYYRVMLTQILMKSPDEALKTYNDLVTSYPTGNPGHPIAEMATAFWNEYQSSQNIANGCDKATTYADGYRPILNYISSSYHGWQTYTYKVTDLCPFK